MYSTMVTDVDELIKDYDRLAKIGFESRDIKQLDGIHVLTAGGEVELEVDDAWLTIYAFPYGEKKLIGKYLNFNSDGQDKNIIEAFINVNDAVADFMESDRI